MDDNKNKSKTFVLGAAILGVAGLITKLLGAVFRIPLTNIIGASGMAYYQTAYPVYVMLLMISTSGLPTAISRMVAERRAREKFFEAHRVFKVSFAFMSLLGAVTGIGLFVFAPRICELQLEPDAVHAMRATAPALIFCPIMSCFRGFFQGRRTMAPTALSQVVEQLFRVGLGLALAHYFLRTDVAHAAAGASFGATAGAFFGLFAIVLLYLKKKNEIFEEFETRLFEKSNFELLFEILTIAIPITLGASIMPILNWIDTLIVKRRLLAIGYEDALARRLFGELSGMAAPIINFPMVFTQAVCMSIVPVVTDAYKRNDSEFLKHNTALGLRYAFIIILPCAAGMIVLSKPIMMLLYPRQLESAVSAASCLAIYAVGMVFLSAIHALTGILQGIGKHKIPVINLFIGAVIKTFATYILTGIPFINVRGAAIGTVLAYFVAAYLNFRAAVKYTDARVDMALSVGKPLLSAVIMAPIAWLVYKAAVYDLGNTVSTLLAIAAGALVYALMVFVTGAISSEDIEAVPRLGRLLAVLKRFKLIK